MQPGSDRGHIQLLATGGTIATPQQGDAPRHSAADLLAAAARGGPFPPVEVEDLTRTPSWAMDLDTMIQVAQAARCATERDDIVGVVVTHGTTTLEYTAFLTDLVLGDTVPVVFTGAMRQVGDDDPDGPRNLRNALHLANHEQARGWGALVCMNGRIFTARDVRKHHGRRVDAFASTGQGPVGTVEGDLIVLGAPPSERPPPLPPEATPGVVVIKAYPGSDGAQVEAAVAGGAAGLVIEGFPGVGGLPPGMFPSLRRATDHGLAVVLTSSAPEGRVPRPPTGGTGAPLSDLGLISAGDLRTEKAWALLSLALAHEPETAAVDAAFQSIAP